MTLDRLEAKGLVSSSRIAVLGSSRRVFAVTPAGEQALADTRSMQERLWHGVKLQVRLCNA